MSETSSLSTKRTNNTNFNSQKLLPAIIAVVLLCALSFYGGIVYQRGHNTASQNAAAGGPGGFGGRAGGQFNGQRPNIGTVTALSPTSITITDNFTNAPKTFSISSATQVTNSGQAAAVTDIKTGDRVLVRTSGTTSTDATQIDMNPSFGGGPGASAGSGSN